MKEAIQNKFGRVQIAESVIQSIAGLAATEVKGVKSLAGGLNHGSITHADSRTLSRCVRVTIQEGKIGLKLAVILDGTVGVPEVARALQEKVKSSVEVMTGNEVTGVDVVVTGVNA